MLIAAQPQFPDAAVDYMQFALEHPGYYQVMFIKSLLDSSNDELVSADASAGYELVRGVATLRDRNAHTDPVCAKLAAWSLVHGF